MNEKIKNYQGIWIYFQSEFRIEMNAIFFCFASRFIFWTFYKLSPRAQLLSLTRA